MICSNCKSEMPDNMKFCTKCGTSLGNGAPILQQAPTYQKVQQGTVYNSTSQYIPQMPMEMQLQELQKKNKGLKIWVGVLAATTVMSIFFWISSSNDLQYLYNHEKERATQAENQLNYYENRGAFDKTVDAVDSWVDIIAPIVDMVK